MTRNENRRISERLNRRNCSWHTQIPSTSTSAGTRRQSPRRFVPGTVRRHTSVGGVPRRKLPNFVRRSWAISLFTTGLLSRVNQGLMRRAQFLQNAGRSDPSPPPHRRTPTKSAQEVHGIKKGLRSIRPKPLSCIGEAEGTRTLNHRIDRTVR